MPSVYITSLPFIEHNNEFCDDKAVISITYPYPNCLFPNGQDDVLFNTDNVLRLKFSDDDPLDVELFDPACIEFKAFDESMADKIIEFVRTAADKKQDILVHCYAGMIRSASIGMFISNMFGYDLNPENSNLQPLQYILDILHEQHMQNLIKV